MAEVSLGGCATWIGQSHVGITALQSWTPIGSGQTTRLHGMMDSKESSSYCTNADPIDAPPSLLVHVYGASLIVSPSSVQTLRGIVLGGPE
jgi:hypothetical protein